MKPIYEEDCPSLESLHPHQISVFFSLLATGSLAESRASSTTISRQYHSLAQAAFSMVPISNEVDIATIQALFLIIRYLFHTDRSSIEERWILTGITIRLAQRVGEPTNSALTTSLIRKTSLVSVCSFSSRILTCHQLCFIRPGPTNMELVARRGSKETKSM